MRVLLLVISLLMSGCINQYGNPVAGATAVTIADIIKNPAEWNGKLVRVEGVFNYELEGDALYLTKEDLKKRKTANAISLGLDDPGLKIPYVKDNLYGLWRNLVVPLSIRMHIGKRAVVVGQFQPQSYGGLFAGYITVKELELK